MIKKCVNNYGASQRMWENGKVYKNKFDDCHRKLLIFIMVTHVT